MKVVAAKTAIFRYDIARAVVSGGVLIVDLAIKPHIEVKEAAAAANIGTASVDFTPAGLSVSIQDKFANPKVQSLYQVRLTDKASGTVLGEVAGAKNGQLVRADFPGTFDPEKFYVLDISVARQGPVLKGPVQFAVKKELAPEKISISALKDKSLVSSVSFTGNKEKTVLRFRDQTQAYKTVKTTYAIKVFLADKKAPKEPIGQATLERQAVTVDKDGRTLVSFKDVLAVSDQVLATLREGTALKVEITTTRGSTRLGQVSFTKTGQFALK